MTSFECDWHGDTEQKVVYSGRFLNVMQSLVKKKYSFNRKRTLKVIGDRRQITEIGSRPIGSQVGD
jgi:hypothetical protein